MKSGQPTPIAIVGMSCRFPGGATDPQRLWELLENGTNTWSHVPSDRYNEKAFYHPNPDDANGSHNHLGGHFLRQDLRDFDNGFFNISPQQAAAMDPQQRILLEVVYEALESAGQPREKIQGSLTSVYTAMFTRDYDRNIYKDTLNIPTYHVTGSGEAILSNRISHAFDLKGPSMTLDTGCSGGMVAVHQACQSLISGESDMAIAGASNLIINPDHQIGMSNLHMLNANGRSYPFDSRGEGYGRGEGFAAFAIKRLSDAVESNDPIRAVILGTGIGQDGFTPAGITRPNGSAQAALARSVLSQARLTPQDIDYVESHGTGTGAGDREEIEALSEVFCEHRNQPLYVGSIKSSIGHLESASGLAGLLKAVLLLERRLIPPNADFQKPKSDLKIDENKIRIPRVLETWPTSEPARASVNSFGYGGTNAHAVLERAPITRARPSNLHQSQPPKLPRLIVLSASSRKALLGTVQSFEDWAGRMTSDFSLADLSYTLCNRRSMMPWRFSLVAHNHLELIEGLYKGPRADAVSHTPHITMINYVFTGQGAQWPGMGRELLSVTSPSRFKDSIHCSRDILYCLGASWDLEEQLLRDDADSQLHVAELAQPVTTAVQIALIDLLQSMGIRPNAVVGHSSGEIAAAYAAGYVSHFSALKISYHRGFMSAVCKTKGFANGAMLAVGLGEGDVSPYLMGLRNGTASVACANSSNSTTISGDDGAIVELAELLDIAGVFNRRLRVDTAYHSHHMQAVADDYRARLDDLEVDESPKAVKFFSTVSGAEKCTHFGADYWVANLVSKVQFYDAVQELSREQEMPSSVTAPHRILIEIGPHNALEGPTRQSVAEVAELTRYDYLATLRRGVGAMESVLTTVGKLFERGCQIDFRITSALDPAQDDPTVLHDLPAYAWDHSHKHWHESRLSRDYRLRKYPYHDLLGVRVTDSTSIEPRWRHMIGMSSLPWLADHVIDGLAIFPGSGYLCMVIEAILQLARDTHPSRTVDWVVMRDVAFLKALVVPDGPQRIEVQLSFTPEETSKDNMRMCHSFRVAAYSDEQLWNEHCRGAVGLEFARDQEQEFMSSTVSRPRHVLGENETAVAKEMSSAILYQHLEAQGNTYGPTFAGISKFAMGERRAEADVTIPDVALQMPASHMEPHVIHPATLDMLLHTSLPLVSQSLGPGSVMPVRIDEISVSPKMNNIPGENLSVSTILTSSHFRTAQADVLVFSTNNDTPVISAAGLELRSLAASPSESSAARNVRDICFDVRWGPDADFLRPEHILLSNVPHQHFTEDKVRILNQAALAYVGHCLDLVQHQNLQIPEQHHGKLLAWMQRYQASAPRGYEANQPHGPDSALSELVSQQGVEGEFVSRLGPQLPAIITGKANPPQILLEDDLWSKMHENSSIQRCHQLLAEYVKHLCFKKAHLSVLEIGAGVGEATMPFLEAMKHHGATPVSYDFTDASADTIERARDSLHEYPINYRTLDMESDPLEQGFEPHKYDVILASNVLHLTSSIGESLSRLRSLLKPNGDLLLVEVTRPQPYLNITLGTLPSWWKGFDDGRTDGPFLPVAGWRDALKKASFGMQLAADDDESSPVASFMVAKAIGTTSPTPLHSVQILVEPDLPTSSIIFASELSAKLKTIGHTVSIHSLCEDNIDYDGIKIVIDDQKTPILSTTSSGKFSRICAMLKEPSKILWISANHDSFDHEDPRKHLITGLSRSAHAENNNLRLVTVHVQEHLNENRSRLLESLIECLQLSFDQFDAPQEREYVYRNSQMLVPRLFRNDRVNQVVSSEKDQPVVEQSYFTDSRRPLVLAEKRGALSYEPVFVDDERHQPPLANSDVEIDVKSLGVPSKGLRSTINEYAGIITAVGSEVSGFDLGDQVLAIGSSLCPSRARVSSTHVQRFPQNLSFDTAAALPIAFMTACYALLDLADLQRCHTILVQGPMSDVGQAVLIMARYMGVTVFATVSEHREAQTLTEKFKVPIDRLIYAHGPARKQALASALGSDGVDAILDCKNSGVISEIAAHLKAFGTIISIYNSGTESAVKSSGSKLPPNSTTRSCDLESLLRAKPWKTASLLQQVLVMVKDGMAVNRLEVTAKPVADIKEAIRLVEHAGYDGKLVLETESNSRVPVLKASTNAVSFESDASYLVAGGHGDLGRRLLHLLAKRGAKHLVTISRQPLKPSDHKKLQSELRAVSAGCRLYSMKCDIANEAAMRSVASSLREIGVPSVKGVVQSAVVLQDRTLSTMTLEDFQVPLKTKVDGTINLQKAFGSDDLDFFIMLSSAVNIVGTSGQGNYNAGNAVQDALAQWQQSSRCHYLSLNLGAIEGADAVQNNETRLNALRRSGLDLVKPEELSRLFEYALSAEAREARNPQVVVGFDSESLSHAVAHNGNVWSAMFSHVRDKPKIENMPDSTSHRTFEDLLAAGSGPDVVSQYIATAIGDKLSDLTTVDASEVDPSRSILDFGLDSLVAIELRNWITRQFDAPLQSSEIMDPQSILALANKVASRSHLVKAPTEEDSGSEEVTNISTPHTSRSPSVGSPKKKTWVAPPHLPLPDLESTLQLLDDSRKAFGSVTEQAETAEAIQIFRTNIGPTLQTRLQSLMDDPSTCDFIADVHETRVYLERRQPLQEYSTFFFGHLVDTPRHSQSERAAIITQAAFDFKRRLEAGMLDQDTINDQPVCMESLRWLFHATRQPCLDLDRMEKHISNNDVVVLRRGHIFQLTVPIVDGLLGHSSLTAAYEEMLNISEQAVPAVATLTADDRDSWTHFRHFLQELHPENATALEVIDTAAFVICLDDEAPATASERCTQFLLDNRHFGNRWVDKTTQFVVAQNGASAGLFEHTKLDGSSVRQLHEHVTRAIFEHASSVASADRTPQAGACQIQEHIIRTEPNLIEHIDSVQQACLARYHPIECCSIDLPSLGREFLQQRRCPANATALLTILLAVRLFYGDTRPAWEIASLAPFAGGRLDWVQTVSSPVRVFLDAAAAAEETSTQTPPPSLLSLFRAAATAHVQAMTTAARGHGFVQHLYALQSVTRPDESSALFESAAWQAARRGGPHQDVKTDCLPRVPSRFGRWQEAGYLMSGDDSVFVHYEVAEEKAAFVVQTRPGKGEGFCGALERAGGIVKGLLDGEL